MFITFEGGEGSGKSTCMEIVHNALERHGHEVYSFNQPGATPFGNKVRELLLSNDGDGISPRAELFMFCASITHFVETKLDELRRRDGAIILCDRWTDSTVAYQGYGRGLSARDVAMQVDIAARHIVPDLTFFFDVSPEEGLKRLNNDERFGLNRIDKETLDFHQRVYNGYLHTCIKNESGRWIRIDASAGKTACAQDVMKAISHKWLAMTGKYL